MSEAPEAALSREDLRVLHQGLNEVLHGPEAIEEWEFETRMGTSRTAAIDLMNRVALLYGTST
jgi:hypothetical protein